MLVFMGKEITLLQFNNCVALQNIDVNYHANTVSQKNLKTYTLPMGLVFASPLIVKETLGSKGMVNEEQMQPLAKAFSPHSSWIQFPRCTYKEYLESLQHN